MNGPSMEWAIPPENIKKYEGMFDGLERSGDKVAGQVVSKVI